MILSYVVYGIFIFLALWGGKFAGFKNSFNEDFSSIKVSQSLRGLCALGILFHHISLQDAFKISGELKIFSVSGIFFVSVFFFYSGYGLIKSIDTKPGYLETFIKCRILKSLVIPFYINIALYAIFFLAIGCNFPASKWICGLLGITLLNEYAWFPIVIVILYLLFYVLFYNLNRREDAFYFIFISICFMALIFCIFGHFPFNQKNLGWNYFVYDIPESNWWERAMQFWFHGEWWINTPIIFLFGMIFANNEKSIVKWFKSFYWLKLFFNIVLFSLLLIVYFKVYSIHDYWSELITGKSGRLDRFIILLIEEPVIILFMILIIQLMLKFESINPITQFLGKYSLETYLMNYMAVYSLSFLINGNHQKIELFTICVIFTTIIFGIIFKFICKNLISFIERFEK